MRELPERRIDSVKRERVRVDSGSLIYVDRNTYSVPSRLIGEQVDVHLSIDRVEVWYGQRKVADIRRLRGRRKHRVDYRHIIDWLVRKPGAFENYRYRDELFPTSRFRMAFDLMQERRGPRANKEYLRILEIAARESEARSGRGPANASGGWAGEHLRRSSEADAGRHRSIDPARC